MQRYFSYYLFHFSLIFLRIKFIINIKRYYTRKFSSEKIKNNTRSFEAYSILYTLQHPTTIKRYFLSFIHILLSKFPKLITTLNRVFKHTHGIHFKNSYPHSITKKEHSLIYIYEFLQQLQRNNAPLH